MRLRCLVPAALLIGLSCNRAPASSDTEASSTGSGEEGSAGSASSTSSASSASSDDTDASELTGMTQGESEEVGEASDDTFDGDGGFISTDEPAWPTTCSPMAQDCPEGEKCVFYVAEPGLLRRDATRCIPVTGDDAPYEPCELPTGFGPEITDTCGAESYCLEVYTSADHGFCAPFSDNWECSEYPGASYAGENGSTFPDACLYYECHPFVEDSCPQDMSCVFYPAFLYGVNFCWKVPDDPPLELGAACDYGECGTGQLCMPQAYVPECATERCCTQWCNTDTPDCSNPAATCEHMGVWNPDSPEYETLGACVIPGSLPG